MGSSFTRPCPGAGYRKTRGGQTRLEIDVVPGAEHCVRIAAHQLGVLADFRVDVAVVAAQPPMLVHVIDEVELAPPQRGALDVVGPTR